MSINLQEIITKLKTAREELQGQKRFAEFATGLDEIISHTSEPLMLMVMGSFSTGKSSFINALVGEEIAAVEAKPTTAVVTKLCYGEQDKLFLHFRDGRVQAATPKEFNRMTAVNDEVQLNEIHDKLYYVERQMPLEILKQVSIIDSPGLNDVQEKHSEATERFVSKADTVLWMFSTVQLATREEMAAMDRLTPRLKPIAVVNKMDLLDEEEDDPQEFLAKAKQTLKDRVQAVVGISAKYELEGKKEHNALKREIGNFAELEKAVADLVLPYREEFKLNTLLDELGVYFAAFNREFAKAKEENEAQKGRSYERYMENAQAFMQIEDILNGVTSGILDYCEREAGQNNEQALYLLGVLYEGGIGVLQDTDKALQFYQKAAMKNHQDAMFNLYVYYDKHGSDDTANYWLKKLAEQGLAEAQNAYAEELSAANKHKEAVQWYERAAKQGNACAQTHLVLCYIYGIGVATDYDVAKKWCDKAVEQNYYAAQYFMAEFFINNDVDKYKYYRKSADQGFADAQNVVGLFFERGLGNLNKNESEAVKWYRKAAEQGLAIAQSNLANCLYEGRGCTINKEEAVELFRKAAKQNLASAQNSLAFCLNNGYGCTEDKAEAFKWYKKAAEQNIANAQNMVGMYLVEGWGGVEKSKEEAVEWFRRAAEQGYAVAQNNLGIFLENGMGCTKNQVEAVEWYRKAAEQGNAGAQYALAKCLENGRGCDVDKEEALKWYRKAAEQGDVDAQMYFAENYVNQYANSVYAAIIKQWCENAAKQNNAKAQYYMGEIFSYSIADKFKWYRKAAMGGNEKAQNMVGSYFARGYAKVVNRDEKQAVEWYRKAAEQGFNVAQYNLAKCLENGVGCNSDKEEAVEWYRKAAEQGDIDAKESLAECLYYGRGCKTDIYQAYNLFKQAAEEGNVSAQLYLAWCKSFAIGCESNEEETNKWLKKAADKGNILAIALYISDEKPEESFKLAKQVAEQGDILAQTFLGGLLRNWDEFTKTEGAISKWVEKLKNKEECYKWARKAAEQGEIMAQYLLGSCLFSGEGCTENKEAGYKWIRKAAVEGCGEAKSDLGLCLINGEGCTENKEEGFQWISQAAKQGCVNAKVILGDCFESGNGCPKDEKEAFYWYKMAAEQNYAYAQNIVGHYFEEGLGGITKNQAEAFNWYKKAAEGGFNVAQFNLGRCFESGNGCPKDGKEADKWYQMAADQGDENAKNALERRHPIVTPISKIIKVEFNLVRWYFKLFKKIIRFINS